MASNLPPGVTDGMIPGNRAEDQEWEDFHLMIDEECEKYNFNPSTAWTVWKIGIKEIQLASLWIEHKKRSQIDLIHADDPPVPDTGNGKP